LGAASFTRIYEWAGAWPGSRPFASGLLLALLNVRFQFEQPLLVLAGVVPAEEELAAGRKDRAYLGSRPAPVATVGGGQVGAGERGVHGRSPSVPAPVARCRSPGYDHCCAVLVPSTLPDVWPAVSVPDRNERSLNPGFNPVVVLVVPHCRIEW
jgi:hypothetical protein